MHLIQNYSEAEIRNLRVVLRLVEELFIMQEEGMNNYQERVPWMNHRRWLKEVAVASAFSGGVTLGEAVKFKIALLHMLIRVCCLNVLISQGRYLFPCGSP